MDSNNNDREISHSSSQDELEELPQELSDIQSEQELVQETSEAQSEQLVQEKSDVSINSQNNDENIKIIQNCVNSLANHDNYSSLDADSNISEHDNTCQRETPYSHSINGNQHNLSNNEDESNDTCEENTVKNKRIPKKFLQNQQKYLEVLERQQRMAKKKNTTDNSRNKNNDNSRNKNNDNSRTKNNGIDKVRNINRNNNNDMNKTNTIDEKQSNVKTRRVIIGGKVKYLPINESPSDPDVLKKQNSKQISVKQDGVKQNNTRKIDDTYNNKDINMKSKNDTHNESMEMDNNDDNYVDVLKNDDTAKRIPSSIAKKMIQHQISNIKKQPPRKSDVSNKKIPTKYAKQIESDVKKQAVRNVKNFADLRRIKALQDINPEGLTDVGQISLIELRKLRIEQRKNEQAEAKRRAESNRRETAIQEILRNEKMSKFAKTIAIKNLSVNSRHKKSINAEK